MISINKVTLQGRVGSDPEIKEFTNGKVANFSLATTVSYKKGTEWENKTTWHRIVAFGNTADFIKSHITKGMIVLVEGSIETSEYEKSGVKITDYKIKVDNISPDWKSSEPKPKPEVKHEDLPPMVSDDDDLPF